MKFSTTAAALAIATPALAQYSNGTVTDIHTTVVTITSCEDNKCNETPVTTGYQVVTEEHTVYTTYCPLTDEKPEEPTQAPAPSDAPGTETVVNPIDTTVVTVTSCHPDKPCETQEVTTGVITSYDVENKTVYTTYCPLTTEQPAPEQPAPSAPAPEQPAPSSAAPAPEQPAPSSAAPAPEQPAPSSAAPAPEQPAPSSAAPAPEQPAPTEAAPEQPAPSSAAPAPEQPAPTEAPAPTTQEEVPSPTLAGESKVPTIETANGAARAMPFALAGVVAFNLL
ncbi:cell wall protein Pga62p [Diutina catenulata]